VLVGPRAERFARVHGIDRCPPALLVVPRELERRNAIRASGGFQVRQAFVNAQRGTAGRNPSFVARVGDTVVAVVLDGKGNTAAGTSTGGTPFKLPGRVGDSPLVGCGYYADSRVGGASCTGWGEGIMRLVLAKAPIDRLAHLDASAAAMSVPWVPQS
jgi:beta-aspartyl-peptidase (threonine type)